MSEEFQAAGEESDHRDLDLIRNHFPAYIRRLDEAARGIGLTHQGNTA